MHSELQPRSQLDAIWVAHNCSKRVTSPLRRPCKDRLNFLGRKLVGGVAHYPRLPIRFGNKTVQVSFFDSEIPQRNIATVIAYQEKCSAVTKNPARTGFGSA